MARNRRSQAFRRPVFTPASVRPVCETWPVLERLALHETTTRRLTFEEDVEIYHAWEARAFGAWRLKVDECGAERAFDRLKECDLTVSSLSWAGGFLYSDGETNDAALADALEAVETAETLQAAALVVLPGTRGSYTPRHAHRMIVDALRRVGDAAGARGVQIALQPIDEAFAPDGSLFDSLDKLLDLLNDCGHQQVGLNLDLFHLRQTPNLLQRIPELLPWTRLVQLSDCSANPESQLDRCLLGEGTLPVFELIEALEGAGYRGFYDVPLTATQTSDGDYHEILQSTREIFEEVALSLIGSGLTTDN